MKTMKHKPYTVVIGLGKTGLSCVRYCRARDIPVVVMDHALEPPCLSECQQEFPDVEIIVGGLNASLLTGANEIMVSPGVDTKQAILAEQIATGKPCYGDIELFARAAKAPIVAITGSNGKTTVTTLLGEMVGEAGLTANVCGNIGTPVLNSLDQPVPDFYVMELSSFQLETVFSWQPYAATVLNVTPDHMDRYENFAAYLQAKQRIYRGCQYAIVNADQPEIYQGGILPKNAAIEKFSLNQIGKNIFGMRIINAKPYLVYGHEPILACDEIPLSGDHHWQNALATLALGHVMRLPLESMCHTLKSFKGIAHRCQWVAQSQGVNWYNDSKATNVGATQAALKTVGSLKEPHIILIAGGQGKGQDFTPLASYVAKYVKQLILLGEDAKQLHSNVGDAVPVCYVNSMKEAVFLAKQFSRAGDAVLLSPACASFDMFNNYVHRGEVFMQAVKALLP